MTLAPIKVGTVRYGQESSVVQEYEKTFVRTTYITESPQESKSQKDVCSS